MAVALALHDVIPVDPPLRWRHPVTIEVHEGTCVVMRTVPALSEALFRLVLGVDRPTTGTVTTYGETPAGLSRHAVRELRCTIGSVLRPDGLVGNMSVAKNLALPLIFGVGMSDEERRLRVNDVINAFGLAHVGRRRPAELSPDTRQVVALARAVVTRPRLLLLDEPLASIGTVESRPLLALCRRFVPTVLAATHRRNAALYDIADEVLLWDEEGVRDATFAPDQVMT